MTTLRDVPPSVRARAARLSQAHPTLADLAELLRSNLETNLADPDGYEIARDAQEDAIDPIAELGFPVELPPLGADGSVVEKP